MWWTPSGYNVITGPHGLYSHYFESLGVHVTYSYYQWTLQAQPVVSNILTFTDGVTVTVTVVMDVSYAISNDDDPVFKT